MLRAIMFDFDGVILESACIKTAAFRKLFQHYPEHSDTIIDYHLNNMGLSRYSKFRHIYKFILNEPLDSVLEEHLGNKFSEMVFQEILAAPFVHGACEFLEKHHQELLLFIISGTPSEELKVIVKRKKINDYFVEIHGSPPGKTAIVSDILSRFELSPQSVLFVGDAESDFEAARNTGVKFIARKSSETKDILLQRAKLWVDDLSELEVILTKV